MKKEIKKEKKSFWKSKLFLFAILPLFVVMVTAGALYYAVLSFSVNLIQPISVNGKLIPATISLSNFDCEVGETCLGDLIRVDNTANEEKTISVSSLSDLDVKYVGKLNLTKKTISDWTPTGIAGDTIEITYTVVGNTFTYKLVSGVIPSGYELVYAMDKENRFTNYATVKRVSEIIESLPMTGDWNAGLDANYCDNKFEDNYAHCRGAKLWIIPTSDIGTNGVLNWANMANYYYETDLVYYFANANNKITIPANSFIEFYPQVSSSKYASGGIVPVTITVA